MNNQTPTQSAQYIIEYMSPYAHTMRRQTFDTLDQAERMIIFYGSCGTLARLIKC
jgi:hypothetical protein